MEQYDFERRNGCSPDPDHWRKDNFARELENLAQYDYLNDFSRNLSYTLMAAEKSLCPLVNGVDTMKYIGQHLSPEAQAKIFPYAPQLSPDFQGNKYLPRLNLEY